MPTLHVVVPVFNEGETLEVCLRRVLEVRLPAPWSLILHLVDDHSTPPADQRTQDVVHTLVDEGHAVSLSRHEVNLGKGAALQTAFDHLIDTEVPPSDLVVVQDADLEYDPADFVALMQPLLTEQADAVVGTRWGPHNPLAGVKRRAHAFMNRGLTICSNITTGLRLTDMECCYKMFRMGVLREARPRITEARFGIEPQFVAALARIGARVAEVPVHYDPRGIMEGKKIGWKDGVRALYVIVRERFTPTPRPDAMR